MKWQIFPFSLSGMPAAALAASLLFAASGAAVSCRRSSQSAPTSAPAGQVDTTARIVLAVSECARLYTTEFKIHKIITYADAPSLEGHVLGVPVKMKTRLGDRKVAIPIDVTLKAYIDFGTFSAENVERTDSTIILTLPDPHIVATASKIDNQGTRRYVDLTRSDFTDAEITALAAQGADSILAHASQYGITEQAERSAAAQLTPLLRRMGYREEHITVRFRKRFADSELLRFIEKQ